MNINEIAPLLNPVSLYKIINDVEIEPEQIGKNISIFGTIDIKENLDFNIAILGINDLFGSELKLKYNNKENNVDFIRKHLYFLYYWHSNIKILDLGNLTLSNTIDEVYNKVNTITTFCQAHKIILITLGGPHNLLLGQFQSIKKHNLEINLTNIDALVDLNHSKRFQEYLFLDSFFSNQNFGLTSYTHLGFQSYYTHPKILDLLNKIKYQFYRLGYVKDNMLEIEPQIRKSNLISFDLCSIANNKGNINIMPSGFTSEEACLLMRFCGMSNELKSLGLYGYFSFCDDDGQAATTISQMIWYFIEGLYYKLNEGKFSDPNLYNTYVTNINDLKIIFYQNKTTKRWWMKLQNSPETLPCSHNDYLMISKNEIPDRLENFLTR